MGRAGFEPATLGLKVRPERRRRGVGTGKTLQRPRLADVPGCDELPVAETNSYSRSYSRAREQESLW
jgi:hypothetical protein